MLMYDRNQTNIIKGIINQLKINKCNLKNLLESGIIKLKTFGSTPLRGARESLLHGRGGSKARKLFEWLLLSGYLTWESLFGLL